MKSGRFFLFADRQDRVWFVGFGVLGYYDGRTYRDLMPAYRELYGNDPTKRGLFTTCDQDEQGTIWLRSWDKDLLRYDGGRLAKFAVAEICAAGALGRDPLGGLWVSDAAQEEPTRVWHFEGGTFHPTAIDPEAGIRRIQSDREGRTWFATNGRGVLYCEGGDDPRTRREAVSCHRFDVGDGLVYDRVNHIYQDREGQMWFGTWGGGVSCYDPYSIQVLGAAEGFPCRPASALRADRRGRVWMGFDSKATSFTNPAAEPIDVGYCDGQRFQALGVELGPCWAIHEDVEGQLWFCGEKGLVCYDGAGFARVEIAEGVGAFALAQDRDGHLLLGCVRNPGSGFSDDVSIVRYDGRAFHTLGWVPKLGTRFFALVEDRQGVTWFSVGIGGGQGPGKGLGRLQEGEEPRFLKVTDGLVHDAVTDLVEDRQGQLWIATRGGLSRFDGETFENFTTENGLPNNNIRCLCEDGQGRLWLGTDAGLVHFDGQTFQTVPSTRIAPVNRVVEDRPGRLCLATLDGTVRYTPAATPPRVRIVEVVADQIYGAVESLKLNAPVGSLSFHCKGLSFRTPPQNMLYTYRLDGYEADWQPAGRQQRAFYQDLPPGEYTFQVKALDRDLNPSEPATVRLAIYPDLVRDGLSEALSRSGGTGEFVGSSAALRQTQAQLVDVASTDLTVLILGETGTGKGLAARTVHGLSGRTNHPLIQVNCGALPESLVESELFGHEKGAFTGAVTRKLGKVELAAGGTLFLDEIGDMTLEAQVKLLRLLEEGTFERVGGTETLAADVRVVAATNRVLPQMVEEGAFREDLFYRLQVFPVRLPPLRERRADIELLAAYFTERMARHVRKQVTGPSAEALALLRAYHWPGNVRELEHTMQRAVVVCRRPEIGVKDLALEFGSPPSELAEYLMTPEDIVSLEEHGRRYIRKVLEQTGWIVKGPHGAAVLLDMHEATLRHRMKKLGIRRK
ncbi:MAG: AAA domain-containing protein [Candidatus Latescibacteria bacterium]|nr:AAA domain-containing protein [Candidatus Latescibacterota bacterium]